MCSIIKVSLYICGFMEMQKSILRLSEICMQIPALFSGRVVPSECVRTDVLSSFWSAALTLIMPFDCDHRELMVASSLLFTINIVFG